MGEQVRFPHRPLVISGVTTLGMVALSTDAAQARIGDALRAAGLENVPRDIFRPFPEIGLVPVAVGFGSVLALYMAGGAVDNYLSEYVHFHPRT